MNINELYDIADNNNIAVYHFPMKSVTAVSIPGNIGIDTNKIETVTEETVCLAHELGHCMKNAFYNTKNICDLREKHEYKADKWAVNTVIPFEKLIKAVSNGITEPWELAEHFNVTEKFVHTAFQIYKNMGKL